jgi:hypothetical protein
MQHVTPSSIFGVKAMLKRVTSALFEEDEDASVSLAVQSQNNNGVERATFDYDAGVLPAGPIQGHPGCTFDVLSDIHQFRTFVFFDPGAPSTARYDLFQVNSAGALVPVGKSVTKAASTPLIGFGIDGVAVVAPVGVGAPVGARPAGAGRRRSSASRQPPPARKKPPVRTTRKTAAKRKAARKTTRTPARRKSATKRPKTTRDKSSPRKRR